MCLALALLAALTLAASAGAGDYWGDEAATDTAAEVTFSEITGALSGRPEAGVRCYSQPSWDSKLWMGGLRQGTVGLTDVVSGQVELAPFICAPLESFRVDRKPRIWCYAGPDQYGQRYLCDEMPSEYGGRCRIKDNVQVCNAVSTALALAALGLAEEAAHLKGIRSKAKAQCVAVQNVAFVIQSLGARAPYAKDIAKIALKQVAYFPKAYRLTKECRDEGPLDLHLGHVGWPSP
jgi:hypothetical protein